VCVQYHNSAIAAEFIIRSISSSVWSYSTITFGCIFIFIAGRHALAPVSVCHWSEFYRQNDSSWVHGSFLQPVLHCVVRNFEYLQNKGNSLWNYAQTLDFKQFRHGNSMILFNKTRPRSSLLTTMSCRSVVASAHTGWAKKSGPQTHDHTSVKY